MNVCNLIVFNFCIFWLSLWIAFFSKSWTKCNSSVLTLPNSEKLKVQTYFFCITYCTAMHCHSGSKWLKPAENKFIQRDFTSFYMKVLANLHNFRFQLPALHIQHLSKFCRNKYNESISQLFWILFLAGFRYSAQLCTARQWSCLI